MGRIDLNLISERIRSGQEITELDLSHIRRYHDECSPGEADCVPEAVWADLNMDEVFSRINTTYSAVGAQYLYRQMHLYRRGQSFPPTRFSVFRKFQNNTAAANRFAKILLRLRGAGSAYISRVLLGKLPEKPVYFPLIVLLSLLFIAGIAGLVFMGKQYVLVVIAMAAVNVVVSQVISFRISSFIPDFGSLGRMLGVAASLADTGETGFEEIAVLHRKKSFIRHLQKKFGWLLADTSRMDDLSASVVAYVNNLLLVNLIVFFSAAKYVKMHRKELTEIYEAIGSLDATMAVAGYQFRRSCCCPEIVDEDKVEVVSMYHPVLEEPVSNSFSLTDHSCLITGSNMAGKTTFIKTIGVNMILSETLGICHAESAVFPSVTVLSTIRRRDDLGHGKSYYYVEIESILEFIKKADSSSRFLFLIDEIFRGTNTTERLASSTAVLKYLGERSMVLVTTHDIELENMLGEKYKMFHFQEQIEDGHHFFDYRIKPGPCRSRNAIRLLELAGYPAEIIHEANSLSKQLFRERHAM